MALDKQHKARLDTRFQSLQEQAHEALNLAFELLLEAGNLWGVDDLVAFVQKIHQVNKQYAVVASFYAQIAFECEAALNEPGGRN